MAMADPTKKRITHFFSKKAKLTSDSRNTNQRKLKDTKVKLPTGQSLNTLNSHSKCVKSSETPSKIETSGQLDTSENRSKYFKDASPKSVSSRLTENMTQLLKTCERNTASIQKNPDFKISLAKTESITDTGHRKKSLTEMFSFSKNTDIRNSKCLTKTYESKMDMDKISKSAPREKTSIEKEQKTTKIEVEIQTTSIIKNGVKRRLRTPNKNRKNVKRVKGVEYQDGIENTKENREDETKTQLTCSMCKTTLVAQLNGGIAAKRNLRDAIRKNYKLIVKDTNLEKVLDGLYSKGVIEQHDKELVAHEPTTQNKNRKLLDILLKNNNQKDLKLFLEELEEFRQDIVKEIMETKKELTTGYEKTWNYPEFVRSLCKQKNGSVVFIYDLKLTESMSLLQYSDKDVTLNSKWDPLTESSIQYLFCSCCKKKHDSYSPLGVYVNCSSNPGKDIQTGQAWFLTSNVTVEGP